MAKLVKDYISSRTNSEQESLHKVSMSELLGSLDTLRAIADRYDLAEISDKIKVRKRDAALPVFVVVTGEGNYGKSSLINAIAGRDIAPVSIVPLTWKIDVYRLSSSNREYAQVRYVGADDYVELGLEEAQNLCLREEERIKNNPASKPNINEVIWHRTDLKIGPEICLVDTPGIEQAGLAVDITSERLVKGLGATYTVDEVWSYYYYRADVVLWVFEATKLESKGTFNTIEQLTKLQTKQIVPVVTKADKVPVERWNEIANRFKNIYGRYSSCGLVQKLFCTVCGGKSDLVGTGVKELRDYITKEIAAQSFEKKTRALLDFTRDTSRELSHILRASAQQLVENVRTMADTADEVALNLMRIGAERRDQVVRLVLDFLKAKAKGLNDFLYPLVKQAIESRALNLIEQGLERYLELCEVERQLRNGLEHLSIQTQSLAIALSKQRRLHRVIIGASGKESRERFSFLIDVKAPSVPHICISDIKYRLPPIGLLEGLGRLFRGLFGMEFKMTEKEETAYFEYLQSIVARLNEIVEETRAAFHNHIRSRIGPALLSGVTKSLKTYTKLDPGETIRLLLDVDQDLRQLAKLSGDENAMPTQFANWARYWVLENRDVALAKRLVMDVLWPRRAEMQNYIASYSKLSGKVKKEFRRTFKAAYRTLKNKCEIRLQSNDAKESAGAVDGMMPGVVKAFLTCGAATTASTVRLNLAAIMDSQPGNRFVDVVVEAFVGFAKRDPSLANIGQSVGEILPDAVVEGLDIQYSKILANRMDKALKQLTNRKIEASVEGITAFGGAFSRSFGVVPFMLASLSPAAGVVAGLVTADCVFGIVDALSTFAAGMGLMLASNRWFKKQSMRRIYGASFKILEEWISDASSLVAAGIDETFFRQLVDKLILHLNPRPLQRLNLGELIDVGR